MKNNEDETEENIRTLLKNPSVKKYLNPLIFYGLKATINSKSIKKNRMFFAAVEWVFKCLSNSLEVSIFPESRILPNEELILDNDIGESNSIKLDFELDKDTENMSKIIIDDLNLTFNKEKQTLANKLFTLENATYNDLLNSIFYYNSDYILDMDNDYILVNLIKEYIFSEESPETSNLLISYGLYASSIELIYCLKCVEYPPTPLFINEKEKEYYFESFKAIQSRVDRFYNVWANTYRKKYENNNLIKTFISSKVTLQKFEWEVDEPKSFKYEPLLPTKFHSFTKFIKDSFFSFDCEEIARQLCLLDHGVICTFNIYEYNKFIKNKGESELWTKINTSQKIFKCFILLFILVQNSLENKKLMTENFISLANACKLLHNYQSAYTIIGALNIVGLPTKKLLWRQLEKKHRDLYLSMEKDYLEVELIDILESDKEKLVFPCVPYYMNIFQKMEYFISKLNGSNNSKIILSKDYKDYNMLMEEIMKSKYPFFKVNPLYDFLEFGFKEVFKTKRWNLKVKLDFSSYIENPKLLDSLLEVLVNNFKKVG